MDTFQPDVEIDPGKQKLLADSLAQMHGTLKSGSWLSIVFAHRDTSYWEGLVAACQSVGFHYVNTVTQPVGVVWSYVTVRDSAVAEFVIGHNRYWSANNLLFERSGLENLHGSWHHIQPYTISLFQVVLLKEFWHDPLLLLAEG